MSDSQVVTRLEDGTYKINQSVVFSCGCANVVPEARNKLRMSGVADIPIVLTSNNTKVKKYIRQIGLDNLVPSLKKGTHSVLYNPDTGKYINLLKSPKTDEVYSNIFNVARGL